MYFLFPETHGRTLEELAFCKSAAVVSLSWNADHTCSVYEDDIVIEQKKRVEEEIHNDDEKVVHIDEQAEKKV